VGYDSNGNTASIVGKDKNGTVLTSFSYTYNNANADTQLRQTMTENDPVASNTYTYSYDAFNRLAQANVTAGTGTSYQYSYDLNGNLTSRVAGAATTSYAYNAASELCWAYVGSSSNSCSSPPTGSTTYTFDSNGNETGSSAGGSFSYNPKNQTTAITYGGATLSPLTYSGCCQTERTSAGSTNFNSGPYGVQISTTGGSSTYTLRDNQGGLIGERIGSAHFYYLTDALGSVVAVVSGDGLTVGDHYAYDPFGNTTFHSGTTANPWGFDGGYSDATGLVKFGARYYDPSTARWTQLDPAGQSPSAFSYANDDPINERDPTGAASAWCNFWGCGISLSHNDIVWLAGIWFASWRLGILEAIAQRVAWRVLWWISVAIFFLLVLDFITGGHGISVFRLRFTGVAIIRAGSYWGLIWLP
jgi:RHS repeat-associated protein